MALVMMSNLSMRQHFEGGWRSMTPKNILLLSSLDHIHSSRSDIPDSSWSSAEGAGALSLLLSNSTRFTPKRQFSVSGSQTHSRRTFSYSSFAKNGALIALKSKKEWSETMIFIPWWKTPSFRPSQNYIIQAALDRLLLTLPSVLRSKGTQKQRCRWEFSLFRHSRSVRRSSKVSFRGSRSHPDQPRKFGDKESREPTSNLVLPKEQKSILDVKSSAGIENKNRSYAGVSGHLNQFEVRGSFLLQTTCMEAMRTRENVERLEHSRYHVWAQNGFLKDSEQWTFVP